MQEQPKMDLRPKRRPKYRGSDSQDPDNPGYNRPNYLKINTTTLTQDYLSPSGQLNQNAKLLVRFVQKANKMYGEARVGKQAGKRDVRDKGVVENDDAKKQGQSNNKSQKVEAQKKQKEMYKFKEIHQNSQLMKTPSQEQNLKGNKSYQNLSQLINNKGIYSGPLANQLSQLQSLYPNINQLNMQGQSHNATMKPSHPQKQPPSTKNKTTKQKPQQKAKPQPKNKEKPQVQATDYNGVKENQSDKLFKPSAYHVAIAYHIFMAKLNQKGIKSAEELDPTYRARVVREQAGISGGRR